MCNFNSLILFFSFVSLCLSITLKSKYGGIINLRDDSHYKTLQDYSSFFQMHLAPSQKNKTQPAYPTTCNHTQVLYSKDLNV